MSIKEIFANMDYGTAPESTEMAEQWYAGRDNQLLHYIDGEWQQAASGNFFETRNPATATVLANVADGDIEDTQRAVAAASAAANGWAALSGLLAWTFADYASRLLDPIFPALNLRLPILLIRAPCKKAFPKYFPALLLLINSAVLPIPNL